MTHRTSAIQAQEPLRIRETHDGQGRLVKTIEDGFLASVRIVYHHGNSGPATVTFRDRQGTLHTQTNQVGALFRAARPSANEPPAQSFTGEEESLRAIGAFLDRHERLRNTLRFHCELHLTGLYNGEEADAAHIPSPRLPQTCRTTIPSLRNP
jgi:hypothetical protein